MNIAEFPSTYSHSLRPVNKYLGRPNRLHVPEKKPSSCFYKIDIHTYELENNWVTHVVVALRAHVRGGPPGTLGKQPAGITKNVKKKVLVATRLAHSQGQKFCQRCGWSKPVGSGI
jgi:hypothetical protein